MSLTYPDSIWYTFNNVYFWPYRGWDTVSDLNYPMERGEYRYFRYNVPKDRASDPIRKAAAACIRFNSINCYEVNDSNSYFCEGFLEPQCDGVTLGRLVQYLLPSAIEVSTTSVYAIEEVLNDLDDFLSLEYHSIHPVTLAGPDDSLLPDSYYPTAAFYKGRNLTSLYRSPSAAEAQALLRTHGMDFYQPYPTDDPMAIAFVLYTGNKTPTPRELNKIMLSDYVAVNLNPLDKDDQRALQRYDRGENVPASVDRFFATTGRGTSNVFDALSKILSGTGEGALKTGDFVQSILRNAPYVITAGAVGLGVYYWSKHKAKTKGA